MTITPVAFSLEELLPSALDRSYSISILIRTILVFSTLVVALTVPYFGKNFHPHSYRFKSFLPFLLLRIRFNCLLRPRRAMNIYRNDMFQTHLCNIIAGSVMAFIGSSLVMLIVSFSISLHFSSMFSL